jgi:uncharacterized tellurite resistance protein B-like protein
MINRIKSFFSKTQEQPLKGGGQRSTDELQVAAAALLVEAARLDEGFGEVERKTVRSLAKTRFDLSDEETDSLLEMAETAADKTVQLAGFARTVKDQFSHEERIGLIEMLWEVAYADGDLHDYEAHLIRRVGGLLYVTDRERGDARKRVLERREGSGNHPPQ